MSKTETVAIVGAGPAGLTAAYELSKTGNYQIIIIEADKQVGGISKTVDYKGNKIDVGGHRFFSKSDWVLNWWQQFLPIYTNEDEVATTYHRQSKTFSINRHASIDEPHMLLRSRKSRIYYQKKLFDYPLKLNFQTLINIGLWRSCKIVLSVIYRRIRPVKEKNLEDFYINRFGDVLYSMFFKNYTYKVWGKHCDEISAAWGRQRVKGLSFRKILRHYITSKLLPHRQVFASRKTEQTLTEYFLYPQKGPGQLWEKVAERCIENGVEIRFEQTVSNVHKVGDKIRSVSIKENTGVLYDLDCDVLISSMPVRNLIMSLGKSVPKPVLELATNLHYRDFIIIGLLLDKMGDEKEGVGTVKDNWLYIQDDDVKVGRLQLFHNWSPFMIAERGTCWIGAEYFCEQGDELWCLTDTELISFAADELEKIDLIKSVDVIDGTVVRMPKAYPSYVGAYNKFDTIKEHLDEINNLFLVGRNGMHKYNNQDHSMLTAMTAVDNIIEKRDDKSNIWSVNLEQDYHEQK